MLPKPNIVLRAAGFGLAGQLLVGLLLAGLAAAAQPSAGSPPGERASFEVEALNPGLGRTPERIDRTTPRDAVDSFLDRSRAGDFAAAAHLLDLTRLPLARQPERGAELARMLWEVLERRVVFDWSEIPSRPDGMAEDLPDDHPFAGRARRSLELAVLVAGRRPVSIRLNRLKPPDADPVWMFARQTVSAIPALHAEYGPGWFEQRLPARWKKKFVGGLRVWELVALPLLLAAAAILFLLLRAAIGYGGQALAPHSISRASAEFRTPLALAVTAAVVLSVLTWVLTFSGIVTALAIPFLWALVIFGVTFAALNAVDATLEIVTDRYVGEIDDAGSSDRRHRYTNIYALRRYILLAAVLISAVGVLYKLDLFDSFGLSLLASAGIATVVLGIAGQAVLGNILASLQIAIAKPIRIGDSVLYENNWAYVEAIYYTFIVLRTWDERRLIVPVRYFISNPFENWTIFDAKSTRTFSLWLDHAADPQVLREVFERLVHEDEDALLDEMLLVAVTNQSEHAQEICFYATAASPTEAWLMQARLMERMGDWIRRNRPEWWPRLRFDREPAAIDRSQLEHNPKSGNRFSDQIVQKTRS